MKRGKPPERKTALRRGDSKLKRSRLNPIGRKAQRERAALDDFRLALSTRHGGQCEAMLFTPIVCSLSPHAGSDAHHVFPEDRDAGRHDPDRGLYLCRLAHQWAHNNPASAKSVGLLRSPLPPAVTSRP